MFQNDTPEPKEADKNKNTGPSEVKYALFIHSRIIERQQNDNLETEHCEGVDTASKHEPTHQVQVASVIKFAYKSNKHAVD